MLPPKQDWPLFSEVPGIGYPEYLNASVELLDRNLEEGRGDRPALYYRDEMLTYGDLMSRVERLSAGLAEHGIGSGDRVLLRLSNTPEFVVSWLAALRMGAVVVATMPLLRARELTTVLQDSDPRLVICQDDLLEDMESALRDFRIPLLLTGEPHSRHFHWDSWLASSASGSPVRTRAEDVALLAYTSGSTGVPKGTVHFHRDILAIADCYSRHILQPTQEDVFGGHPTLAFTFGLGGLLVFPFRVGAATVFIDRFSPQTMVETTGRFGISILFCAPTSYKMMLRSYGAELKTLMPDLRLCVSAGETLSGAVYEQWYQRTGVKILDGIGATEMLHIFISNSVDDIRLDSTGVPVPGYQARIVDDQMKEVAAGTEGLLAVRGPTGCRYWNNPEGQRRYVRQGWNLTGDIFSRDAEGYFHYCCRSDDMIICGGANIAGPEVENVLTSHPSVRDAAVVASPDELKGFVPKAFLVLNPGFEPTPSLIQKLKDYVKSEIAPYKYPRKIEFVADLPRTETGKIQRSQLRREELRQGQSQ